MNQHASKTSVPPSVGADVSGIETLLNRNLPEVFGEGDSARRRAAIQELYTEDCVLYVPPGTFVGHDALDKFAADLRATHPHFVYTPHGAPQVLHNSGRLAWGSGPKGETPAYTGVDFIIARDGKIAALYVYLELAAQLAPANTPPATTGWGGRHAARPRLTDRLKFAPKPILK